jgi:hypothetical protein
MSLKKKCAYCGNPSDKRDREHVIPSNLYPSSKNKSKIQRLTIPACNKCNNSWADDEAHFRNILVTSGDPSTPERNELFYQKVLPSFDKVDGNKRLFDLIVQLKPVIVNGELRDKIFPGNDPRVVRVVRKIIRGLSYYHELEWPISDERVSAFILTIPISKEIIESMEYHHRDPDIVEYRFININYEDINSVWLLKFYRKITFIGFISPDHKLEAAKT